MPNLDLGVKVSALNCTVSACLVFFLRRPRLSKPLSGQNEVSHLLRRLRLNPTVARLTCARDHPKDANGEDRVCRPDMQYTKRWPIMQMVYNSTCIFEQGAQGASELALTLKVVHIKVWFGARFSITWSEIQYWMKIVTRFWQQVCQFMVRTSKKCASKLKCSASAQRQWNWRTLCFTVPLNKALKGSFVKEVLLGERTSSEELPQSADVMRANAKLLMDLGASSTFGYERLKTNKLVAGRRWRKNDWGEDF